MFAAAQPDSTVLERCTCGTGTCVRAMRQCSATYPLLEADTPVTDFSLPRTPPPFFLSRGRPQAGLAIDPSNNGLESSLAVAKEGQETDRRERWRKAALEREAEEERLKKRDAFKAQAKAEAADAAKAGAAHAAGAAGAAESDASGDPLSSFFSEIEGEKAKPPPAKAERVLHDKYTNQELGTPKEQMDRLLQHNYKWKNLNAFETLQLGPDATVEDIKQRWAGGEVGGEVGG